MTKVNSFARESIWVSFSHRGVDRPTDVNNALQNRSFATEIRIELSNRDLIVHSFSGEARGEIRRESILKMKSLHAYLYSSIVSPRLFLGMGEVR